MLCTSSKDKSNNDVLGMSIEDAEGFFQEEKLIAISHIRHRHGVYNPGFDKQCER
ncbi:hypothetical protein [Paenibacillus spongiae]|uniref:Uncharacterized protein n=1 Tax=Paenibacillus spongiae TaxID=2909671 RepID=A0ABY5S7W8_9BACL|nr:hypothetical protein [Paenibacillus spongiae]UVI30021.1 hypothetical protein L1F29_32350 [Paenibacillus spongiae]